jgi:hypothetical protein
MGLGSFFRKVFYGESDEDPGLRAARARHNIVVDEDKKGDTPARDEAREPYDPWEEVENVRRSFFLGSWASRKVGWRPDHDRLKEELAALEKKREEEGKG